MAEIVPLPIGRITPGNTDHSLLRFIAEPAPDKEPIQPEDLSELFPRLGCRITISANWFHPGEAWQCVRATASAEIANAQIIKMASRR
jgi:hypothetical protein